MTPEAFALQAAQTGVALYDRSHWNRIEVSGADRLTFLHNQSTNDLKQRQPGEGCDTVFLTSTARTLDLATAYILEDVVWLLVSPTMGEKLMQWLDRYIFFADQVKLADISSQTATLSISGAETDRLLEILGSTAMIGQPAGHHQVMEIAGEPVRIAVGSGLATAGYTLMTTADHKLTLMSALIDRGAVLMTDQAWEQLRILQGRPLPDRELTPDYNPLEAGLWQTISFNKGCYIGQETIARLDTYKGVKQQLWGVQLTASAEPGTPVMLDQEKIGTLTSLVATAEGWRGLAYIKTKAGGAGLTVTIGEAAAAIVDLPFLTRERQET
jgi:tRNA-modifying protein YgfZ